MQLIIDKKGTGLSVKNGLYLIRHDEGEQQLAPSKVSAIFLSPASKITHEVVRIALENETEITFVDRRGQPFARVWSPRYGSVSTIRKNQVDFVQSPAAIAWVKDLISRKTENQIALLAILASEEPGWEQVIIEAQEEIEATRSKMMAQQGETLKELANSFRGSEGRASRLYFTTLSKMLPEAYRFEKRSRQPARDMFNAMLNYAYGMLYARVETALIKSGIDPYLGIFHRDEYNRPVLVYDCIEHYRVWADYVVSKLCMEQAVFPDFFTVEEDAWWLQGSSKRIVAQSMNDYLGETVMRNGLSRSRATHIDLEMQALATMFKQFNQEDHD
ncbi:MAG: CRISPR-associated endonuclease Cas1 [Bacteroidia bacterium]